MLLWLLGFLQDPGVFNEKVLLLLPGSGSAPVWVRAVPTVWHCGCHRRHLLGAPAYLASNFCVGFCNSSHWSLRTAGCYKSISISPLQDKSSLETQPQSAACSRSHSLSVNLVFGHRSLCFPLTHPGLRPTDAWLVFCSDTLFPACVGGCVPCTQEPRLWSWSVGCSCNLRHGIG